METEIIVSADQPESVLLSEQSQGQRKGAKVAAGIVLGAVIVAASVVYASWNIGQHIDKLASKTAVSAGQAAGQQAAQAGQQPAQGPADIALKPNTPYLGSGDAKVTVVEYADYQCPFCERFFTSVMPTLKSKYIDTGKIKFVYQDFAFLGPDSNTAAEGSHCAADQNKFWQYHDYLFQNQGQENSGWATAEKIKAVAKTLGLNTSQFNQCLDSHKYAQEVLDETSAGKNYGVSGTPTVFVNGVAIVGAQPEGSFTQAIDAALAK